MKTAGLLNKSDEILVQEYLNGNTNSLGILYDRYYTKVYQKCLSFSKNTDDAFDLTQDILMKAFANVASFKGSSKFSTWLFAITRNYCITNQSKAKRIIAEDLSENRIFSDDTIDSDRFQARRDREQKEDMLLGYLDRIPNTDRRIIELKYHQNYSIKELQEELSLSASAVKMRLLRARHKLEHMLIGA